MNKGCFKYFCREHGQCKTDVHLSVIGPDRLDEVVAEYAATLLDPMDRDTDWLVILIAQHGVEMGHCFTVTVDRTPKLTAKRGLPERLAEERRKRQMQLFEQEGAR